MKITLARNRLAFDFASPQVLNDGFRCQIIGEPGSGKSSTAALISIQAIERRLQVILLDAHGEYAPLAAAGKGVHLVGYNSRLSEPLYATPGAIERYMRIIASGKSVLFNLSEWVDLDPESLDRFLVGSAAPKRKRLGEAEASEESEPVKEFQGLLQRLYTLRRHSPKMTLLVGEEFQNIAPIIPLAGEAAKIRIVTGILTGGRKFGLQSVLCTQAPALVNARIRSACNVRIYLRISDWNDWKNGVKSYIPDDLGVVWDDGRSGAPFDPDTEEKSIRSFPPGYAVVLTRWYGNSLLQLDQPSISPNKTVPSMLT